MAGGPRLEFGRNDVEARVRTCGFASTLLVAMNAETELAATTCPTRWPGTAGVPLPAKGQ